MKFGENLQKLRKEKKISQEQLAEQLGVTRQSVSKWESGVSYPEMDKLVSICKIFNCDLDSLINKDISEDLNKKEASGIVKNIFKEAMSYIEKTVRLFEQKSFKEIIKIIAQIILIIIIIFLFSIPFQLIEGTISNAFYLENNYISHFFSSLCEFIFNVIYVVLAITAFLYIFKIKFLDEYSEIETKEIKENINTEDNKENKKVEKVQKVITKTIRETTLTDILVKLITIFIKFCLLLFLIPVVITAVLLIISLVLLLIIIFKGVFLLGPIICLIAGVILSILIIELILNFTLNLKFNKKRIIITIIVSTILGSIGLGLSIWYFMNLTIINDVPESYKLLTKEEVLPMTDNFKFHHIYSNIEYIPDESLANDVVVKIEYYDNYCKDIELIKESDAYITQCKENNAVNGKEIVNIFLNDLKNKKLYTYVDFNSIKYTITTSQTNIDKIIKNQEDFYQSEYLDDDIIDEEVEDDYE